jgi:hypothetical protein
MRKHTILFLAANPSDTDRLALDREARAIEVELERGRWRDCFEFVTRWAAEPLDLLRELRRLRPTVVQFSGHGGRRAAGAQQGSALHRDVVVDLGPGDGRECHGLFFQGADGTARVVSAAALRDTFGAAGSSVKLVVLNACYSEAAAEALLAHVDCVVGMAGSIRDDAARSFAVGFYGGLGERASVEAAHKGGCAAIGLEGFPDGDRPRLRARRGVDPGALILAALTPAGLDPIAAERQTPGARHRSTVKSTAGEPVFTGRKAELEGGHELVTMGERGAGFLRGFPDEDLHPREGASSFGVERTVQVIHRVAGDLCDGFHPQDRCVEALQRIGRAEVVARRRTLAGL